LKGPKGIRVSGGQEKQRQASVEPASVGLRLCQHLGMAVEEGVYSQDKMSDPAYNPPMLSTSAKVAKRGAYMQDTMMHVLGLHVNKYIP